MTTAAYTITITRTKVQDVPAPLAQHIRIETRVRKPESRAYTVDIPTASWVDTSDCPVQYRSLVDSAFVDCAESVLNGFVTNTKTAGNNQIPATLFVLERLLAQNAAKRMTSAMLIGMWRNSSKYVFDVAPKLATMQGSQLLRYQAAIEKHEKRLAALCGRSPETAMIADDLDKLMVNLSADDAETQYGQFIADRTEEVRAKLVDVEDAL